MSRKKPKRRIPRKPEDKYLHLLHFMATTPYEHWGIADIAANSGFPLDDVNRIVENAIEKGHVANIDGSYHLSVKGRSVISQRWAYEKLFRMFNGGKVEIHNYRNYWWRYEQGLAMVAHHRAPLVSSLHSNTGSRSLFSEYMHTIGGLHFHNGAFMPPMALTGNEKATGNRLGILDYYCVSFLPSEWGLAHWQASPQEFGDADLRRELVETCLSSCPSQQRPSFESQGYKSVTLHDWAFERESGSRRQVSMFNRRVATLRKPGAWVHVRFSVGEV